MGLEKMFRTILICIYKKYLKAQFKKYFYFPFSEVYKTQFLLKHNKPHPKYLWYIDRIVLEDKIQKQPNTELLNL